MKITKEKYISIGRLKYTEYKVILNNGKELTIHIDKDGFIPGIESPIEYITELLSKVDADTNLAPMIMIKLVAKYNL